MFIDNGPILARLSPAQYSLTMQNRDLTHHFVLVLYIGAFQPRLSSTQYSLTGPNHGLNIIHSFLSNIIKVVFPPWDFFATFPCCLNLLPIVRLLKWQFGTTRLTTIYLRLVSYMMISFIRSFKLIFISQLNLFYMTRTSVSLSTISLSLSLSLSLTSLIGYFGVTIFAYLAVHLRYLAL